MNQENILIVEDETLIAETIKLDLEERGYNVIDSVIKYEDAIGVLNKKEVDLVLIDIRLFGNKSGLDLAKYLTIHKPTIPFIFLTSHNDQSSMDRALKLNPKGYIAKPVNKKTLWATIEIVFANIDTTLEELDTTLTFNVGKSRYLVKESEITYIKVDHVYSQLFRYKKNAIVLRQPLAKIFDQLKSSFFILPHKSYIVNVNFISKWNQQSIWIGEVKIPISRGRKKEILERLAKC